MGYGFEAYDENFKLQFDSNMLTCACQRSGSVATIFSGFGTEVSFIKLTNITDTDIIVLNCPDGYGACVSYNGVGLNDRAFVTDAPIGTIFNYYVYKTSNNIGAPGSFGLEAYNPQNQMTFSSNQRALQAPALLVIPDRNTLPVYTMLGRKMGFVVLGYGGYKEYGNIDPDSGGYSYDHYWYGYGAGISSGQQVVATKLIETVNGRYFTSSPSFDFSNVYDVPAAVLAVDVTNVPIGQTFF